jgi:hypothetical protein
MMRRRHSQTGSALIEAAFVLPVFALLICGSLDIARVLQMNQVAAAAARAGVHHALGADPHILDLSAIENAAGVGAGQPGFAAKASRVCACTPDAAPSSCDTLRCSNLRLSYLRVETSAQMKPLIRYPGVPSLVAVRSEAFMRIE